MCQQSVCVCVGSVWVVVAEEDSTFSDYLCCVSYRVGCAWDDLSREDATNIFFG